MEVLARAALTSLGLCWSVASDAYVRESREKEEGKLEVDGSFV